MRDHERAEVGADETLDAARDGLQRVDVEARVGLVEHRDPRLQHRHLQDLDPLLLAAGEAVVQVARGELAADLELVHLLEQLLAELRDRDRIVHAAVSGLARRVDRAAQEARDGDAGDGLRILEREEEAALGTLVGAELRDVLAVEQQGAFGDLGYKRVRRWPYEAGGIFMGWRYVAPVWCWLARTRERLAVGALAHQDRVFT